MPDANHASLAILGSDPGPRRLSDVLKDLVQDTRRERVSVGDLLNALGDRAFGALMLLFALPNIFPTPPGTSGILGIPLVILAAQLMLARKPWLPRLVRERSMQRNDFASVVARALPWLVRAEKLLQPRIGVLVRPPAEYAVGLLCFVLAVILVLPIPLGNILPAIAICLFSLGILEGDGLWVLGGVTMFGVSVAVVGGVVLALFKAAVFVLTGAFA